MSAQVFTTVSNRLNLSNQWTGGESAWLHALLQAAAADFSAGDTLANPFSEVSRRLDAAGINPRVSERVKQLLASEEAKYAAGARP